MILTFNFPTITCTSTGGPASDFAWIKDGQSITLSDNVYQKNQIIIDTQTGKYQNTLVLATTSILDFNSMYECIVKNSIGSQNASVELKGKLKL